MHRVYSDNFKCIYINIINKRAHPERFNYIERCDIPRKKWKSCEKTSMLNLIERDGCCVKSLLVKEYDTKHGNNLQPISFVVEMYAAILACAAIQHKILFLNVYYTHDIDLTIQRVSTNLNVFKLI
jgi:hypothetical protein